VIETRGGRHSRLRESIVVSGRRAAALFMATLLGSVVATAVGTPTASADPGFRRAVTPAGWAGLCQREAISCRHYNRVVAPRVLTPDLRAELEAVNSAVNREIAYVTDQKALGLEEFWSFPIAGKGDCEDIALLKRRRLMERGWPRSSLLMTVVVAFNGEWHAVLSVETAEGFLILDNMTDAVLTPEQSRHRFFSSQSRENPNRWVMWTTRDYAGRSDHRPEGAGAPAPATRSD
jgi:predicted transglutaminase-like cysteine proteinase